MPFIKGTDTPGKNRTIPILSGNRHVDRFGHFVLFVQGYAVDPAGTMTGANTYAETSVNPARSIAPALFEGGKALSQLWLFIVAPFVGAALSAVVWKYIVRSKLLLFRKTPLPLSISQLAMVFLYCF